MPAAAGLTLVLATMLVVGGLMGPPYLRSSLFDRRPTYNRVATEKDERTWRAIRQRQIASAERFRTYALSIGVPLFLVAAVLLVIS